MQSTAIIWCRLLISLLALPFICVPAETYCNGREYDQDSFVCVCNSQMCDYVEPPGPIAQGRFFHYRTSRLGSRLYRQYERIIPSGPDFQDKFPPNAEIITTDSTRTYQEVLGFGGAMTDAAGINIASLSWETQTQLVRQYFGDGGIDYTFIRVPIGGTDFSTYNYTYLDAVDEKLQSFQLSTEDYDFKIPYIKMARSLSRSPLKLIASAWSCPEWMKELRNGTIGFTGLKKQYYQLWADYYIKFFDAYNKQEVQFWGLTGHNEPSHGRDFYFGFNNLGWTPEEMRDWIADYLGPTLERSGYGDLKLIMLDDVRTYLPVWPKVVLAHREAWKYISGIGVHWYADFDNNPRSYAELTLTETHNLFPEKFLLYTEADSMPFAPRGYNGVKLGNWERAENYSYNIIEDMNHWVTGWVDWNMALDMYGGPNWISAYGDAPIIVNATADEFYKQPMFYALAHFSKFVPPGSRRIHMEAFISLVKAVAFITPDNKIVVVILNREDKTADVFLKVTDTTYIIVTCPGHSIHTVLYNADSHSDVVTTRMKPLSKPGYGYNGQKSGHNGKEFGYDGQGSGYNGNGFGYGSQGSGHNRQGFVYDGQGSGHNGQEFGYDGQGSGHNGYGFGYGRQGSGHNRQGFVYDGHGSGHNGQEFGYDGQGSGHNGQEFGYDGQGSGHNGYGFGYGRQGSGHNRQGFVYNAQRFGYNVQGSGNDGQGLRYDDQGAGRNGQGFGYGDQGYGSNGQGFGYNILGSGYNGQGLGYNRQGSGHNGQKFGYASQGSVHNGQGIGYNGQGSGRNGQGIGYNGQGSGRNGQGIGYNGQGSGRNGQGIGYNGQGSGRNGQGIGYNGQGSGRNGQGIGHNGQGSGRNGQGIGYNGQGSGRNGQGIGYNGQGSGRNGYSGVWI